MLCESDDARFLLGQDGMLFGRELYLFQILYFPVKHLTAFLAIRSQIQRRMISWGHCWLLRGVLKQVVSLVLLHA